MPYILNTNIKENENRIIEKSDAQVFICLPVR